MCKSIAQGGVRCSHGKTGRRTQKFFGGQSDSEKKFASLPTAFREGKVAERAEVVVTSTDAVVVEAALNDAPAVRTALASNPLVDPATLAALIAGSPELAVLRAVAANPVTDAKTLEALAINPSPSVRKAAAAAKELRPPTAEKPNTPAVKSIRKEAAMDFQRLNVPASDPTSPAFGRKNKVPPAPRSKPVPAEKVAVKPVSTSSAAEARLAENRLAEENAAWEAEAYAGLDYQAA